jgi:hypothetical protein
MSRRRSAWPDARWWIVIGTAVSLATLTFYLLNPKSGAGRRTRLASQLKPRRAVA